LIRSAVFFEFLYFFVLLRFFIKSQGRAAKLKEPQKILCGSFFQKSVEIKAKLPHRKIPAKIIIAVSGIISIEFAFVFHKNPFFTRPNNYKAIYFTA
jgi:hypothetical protein